MTSSGLFLLGCRSQMLAYPFRFPGLLPFPKATPMTSSMSLTGKKRHLLSDIFWNFNQILLILIRNNDLGYVSTQGSKRFFLEAAYGQNPAPKRYLSRSWQPQGEPCRPEICGIQSGGHGYSGRRSVLGDGTCRNVDMDIGLVKVILSGTKVSRAASAIGQGRLRRFFHHTITRAARS